MQKRNVEEEEEEEEDEEDEDGLAPGGCLFYPFILSIIEISAFILYSRFSLFTTYVIVHVKQRQRFCESAIFYILIYIAITFGLCYCHGILNQRNHILFEVVWCGFITRDSMS